MPIVRVPSRPAVCGLTGSSGLATVYSAAFGPETAAFTMHWLMVRYGRIQSAAGANINNGVIGGYQTSVRGAGMDIGGTSVRMFARDATTNNVITAALSPQGKLCCYTLSFQVGAARGFLDGALTGTPLTPASAIVPSTVWNVGCGGVSLPSVQPGTGITGIVGIVLGNVAQDDATVLATVQQWDLDFKAGRYLTPFAGQTHYWDAADLVDNFYNASSTWVDRTSAQSLSRTTLGASELRYDFVPRIL